MFRAPLTGSLLLFELTRDYDILLPLMGVSRMGSLLVELVERKRKADEAILLNLEKERRGAEGGGQAGQSGGEEGREGWREGMGEGEGRGMMIRRWRWRCWGHYCPREGGREGGGD